jgi:hypothetical protein
LEAAVKATIELPALLAALRVISPALARTNPVRMAACGWTARDGLITLRAASLDWDAQYAVPAEVAAAGEAWMPADLVRALPWGHFADAVQLRATGRELEIRSGGLAYALPVLDPDTVTALAPALAPCAEAPGSALARTLLLGASAAHRTQAADDTTPPSGDPEREGAWLEVGSGRLTVSSTDRVRIATATTAITGDARFRAALPIHAAATLARAAAQADTATLLRTKREPSPALTVTAGPATVTVRALASLPPDPTGLDLNAAAAPTRVRGRADTLAAGLRAALAVAGTDPYAVVHLRSRMAHLTFHVAAQGGRASASVALEHVSGADAGAVLPARALLATLAPLGDAEVTLGLGHPAHPVLVAAVDGAIAYRGLVAASGKAGAVSQTSATALA